MAFSIGKTTKILAVVVAAVLGFALVAPSSGLAKDKTMISLPQDLEIKLSLSALPPHLREDATVLILDEDEGYKVHQQGSNGFTTLVARTSTRFYQAEWEYHYPEDQLIPVAYDSVGVAFHLQPWLDVAKMRADGLPPAQTKARIRENFSNGTYKAPDKGGVSYMLAPIHRAYSAPEQSDATGTYSFPHYMPYAPHVSGAQLGNYDPSKGMPIALTHGMQEAGPHGYLVFKLPDDQIQVIQNDYAAELEALCTLHENWCLDTEG